MRVTTAPINPTADGVPSRIVNHIDPDSNPRNSTLPSTSFTVTKVFNALSRSLKNLDASCNCLNSGNLTSMELSTSSGTDTFAILITTKIFSFTLDTMLETIFFVLSSIATSVSIDCKLYKVPIFFSSSISSLINPYLYTSSKLSITLR
ncbi:hypothetical protein D3C75_602730 [compost metagenome]